MACNKRVIDATTTQSFRGGFFKKENIFFFTKIKNTWDNHIPSIAKNRKRIYAKRFLFPV
jgi:hypothetical protein